MDHVGERERRRVDPLAAAEIIDQELHILVERRQDDVGDQPLVAGLTSRAVIRVAMDSGGCSESQDPFELGRGQIIRDRAEPVGTSQHVLDGVGKHSGPADHVIHQDRVAPEMHRGAPRQVPRLVDQAPHNCRPSQNRLYDELVRNTRSSPSATPTSVCTVAGMST